jgi:hypothetical protein
MQLCQIAHNYSNHFHEIWSLVMCIICIVRDDPKLVDDSGKVAWATLNAKVQNDQNRFVTFGLTHIKQHMQLCQNAHNYSNHFHEVWSLVMCIICIVRDDPKLVDDNGKVPKSEQRGWRFDSWM